MPRSLMIQRHSFLKHVVDEAGMPNLDYELFYQQGISCYCWGLPKPYVRQALRAVCRRYAQRFGDVSFWQLRAFAYGLRGLSEAGQRERYVQADYAWPLPPSGWNVVVCLYPDGMCDFDFAHPVSRRFWSEDNGLLKLPSYDRSKLGSWWFEEMGFEIMLMQASMQLEFTNRPLPHLKLV